MVLQTLLKPNSKPAARTEKPLPLLAPRGNCGKMSPNERTNEPTTLTYSALGNYVLEQSAIRPPPNRRPLNIMYVCPSMNACGKGAFQLPLSPAPAESHPARRQMRDKCPPIQPNSRRRPPLPRTARRAWGFISANKYLSRGANSARMKIQPPDDKVA